jgi:hypothetical protein
MGLKAGSLYCGAGCYGDYCLPDLPSTTVVSFEAGGVQALEKLDAQMPAGCGINSQYKTTVARGVL